MCLSILKNYTYLKECFLNDDLEDIYLLYNNILDIMCPVIDNIMGKDLQTTKSYSRTKFIIMVKISSDINNDTTTYHRITSTGKKIKKDILTTKTKTSYFESNIMFFTIKKSLLIGIRLNDNKPIIYRHHSNYYAPIIDPSDNYDKINNEISVLIRKMKISKI